MPKTSNKIDKAYPLGLRYIFHLYHILWASTTHALLEKSMSDDFPSSVHNGALEGKSSNLISTWRSHFVSSFETLMRTVYLWSADEGSLLMPSKEVDVWKIKQPAMPATCMRARSESFLGRRKRSFWTGGRANELWVLCCIDRRPIEWQIPETDDRGQLLLMLNLMTASSRAGAVVLKALSIIISSVWYCVWDVGPHHPPLSSVRCDDGAEKSEEKSLSAVSSHVNGAGHIHTITHHHPSEEHQTEVP
jgi:hypothetical protein